MKRGFLFGLGSFLVGGVIAGLGGALIGASGLAGGIGLHAIERRSHPCSQNSAFSLFLAACSYWVAPRLLRYRRGNFPGNRRGNVCATTRENSLIMSGG
jgi:hypothetical protein